jgi:hypothetical protein
LSWIKWLYLSYVILCIDTGQGIAKEDAEDYLNENAPNAILKKFEEKKWQDKKAAYDELANWVVENDFRKDPTEASFWFARVKMKEWKEK